jgi:hypothetical protein
MSEAQVVDVKFEGAKVVVTVDPNKDGSPLVKVELDLLQIPAEVKELIK